MKKVIVLLLAAVLSCGLLIACTDEQDEEPTPSPSPTENVAQGNPDNSE